MKPAALESWIVGGFILVLLAVLHWLAFRVGERRARRRREAAAPRRESRERRRAEDIPIPPPESVPAG
jgi:peptidoglycan/LPS O-acetylase OafA/YrhL